MSKGSSSATPAQGSPVTLRIVLPQPSREERPASLICADELGGVGEGDVVDLDVLPGGDVALVQWRELLDRVGKGLHLLRADAAERQLHPDHLHVGLALAVDALLEAEADELLLGLLPAQEAGRLGVEVVEFPLEDRDHVARDVVVDLRVLERAGLALAVLLLARVLLEARGVRELLGGPGLAVAGLAPFFSGVETGSMENRRSFRRRSLPGVYRPLNLANLIEFQVIMGGRDR